MLVENLKRESMKTVESKMYTQYTDEHAKQRDDIQLRNIKYLNEYEFVFKHFQIMCSAS